MQNPDSQGKWILFSFRGAKALGNGEARELSGFKILSASEFIIDLEQPLSFFPSLLSYPSTAIIPEGAIDLSGASVEQCIGTGPFRVARFESGRILDLEANPDYWRKGFPKSDGLVVNMGISPPEILAGFQSGRFSLVGDLFPSDVEALRHSKIPFKYRETPQLCTYTRHSTFTKNHFQMKNCGDLSCNQLMLMQWYEKMLEDWQFLLTV